MEDKISNLKPIILTIILIAFILATGFVIFGSMQTSTLTDSQLTRTADVLDSNTKTAYNSTRLYYADTAADYTEVACTGLTIYRVE